MIRIECNGDVTIALDWKKKEREEGLEVICGRRICSQFRDENFFAEFFFWCKKVIAGYSWLLQIYVEN